MGTTTTPLRQLLKSLCSNSPWKYSVLWKIRHQNPLILTWEDGYCVYPGPRQPAGNISYGIYSSQTSDITSQSFQSSIGDGGLGGYPIALLVASMSQLHYAWDEGVIGKVARTEKHCWVSYEDFLTGKADSIFFAECPEEWLLQFTSGIKTIVLVPVLPHGVLQLGSFEMVPEDLEVISHIKERFTQHTAGGNVLSLPFKRNFEAQSSASLICSLLENLDESSAASISPVKMEDSRTFDRFKPGNALLTLDQVVPILNFQNTHPITATNLQEILDNATVANLGATTVSPGEESSPLNQSMKASQPEMVESKLFGMSCPDEDLMTYLASNSFNLDDRDFLTGFLNPSYSKDFVEEPFGGMNINDSDHEALSSFFSFPQDCELHKALGPSFKRDSDEYLLDSSILSEDFCSNSTLRALVGGIEPVKGGNAEDLLQAVVANKHGGSDDSSSNESSGVKSSITSTEHKAVTSTPPQAIAAFVTKAKSDFNAVSSPSLSSTMTTLNDGEWPRKGRKPPNGGKRRTRPGDSPKQRPRDRQLIQDRVKELRELVPNGAKCSIDGLLDQTIKHMMYLQSMTNQAEKLQHWVHQEVAGRKNLRSVDTKDECQKGKSWAFEIGGEQQVCPIIVEDLPYPGHLLIEMLCNEQGMFLEIAQVIRSFNLTILKGEMEDSEKKTWAHFIVETSRGFHRLDIFWPLMQLLQRRRNPISSKI